MLVYVHYTSAGLTSRSDFPASAISNLWLVGDISPSVELCRVFSKIAKVGAHVVPLFVHSSLIGDADQAVAASICQCIDNLAGEMEQKVGVTALTFNPFGQRLSLRVKSPRQTIAAIIENCRRACVTMIDSDQRDPSSLSMPSILADSHPFLPWDFMPLYPKPA